MNEYLAACLALPKSTGLRGDGFPLTSWDTIPTSEWTRGTQESYRWEMIPRYSFAIPNDRAIAALAALSPLVEIGAGRGYWAYLLQQAGADVLPFDTYPKRYADSGWWRPGCGEPWTKVLRGGPERAGRYPERTLFLCWPPHGDGMASRALRAYRRAGGQRVAYVGEGDGGCTGDEAFHRALERDWQEARLVRLPHWSGINDWLWIYRRKR